MRGSEVMDGEFVVPVRFIIGLLYGKGVMVNPVVVPFTILVKQIHFFSDFVCVNHVKV